MKKILLTVLAVMALTPALVRAEERDKELVIASSSDDKVQLDVISHVGYGVHLVTSDEFKSSGSSEFFFNILQLGIYPTKSLGFELGVDMNFNEYTSKTTAFYQDEDGKVQATDFARLASGTISNTRGGINVMSFTAPLMVKGIFNKFKIGAGVLGSVNLPCNAYYKFKQQNRYMRVEEKKGKVNTFNYGFVASVSFDQLGVYFKYFPKTSKVLPDGSVDFNYASVGIALGF